MIDILTYYHEGRTETKGYRDRRHKLVVSLLLLA